MAIADLSSILHTFDMFLFGPSVSAAGKAFEADCKQRIAKLSHPWKLYPKEVLEVAIKHNLVPANTPLERFE